MTSEGNKSYFYRALKNFIANELKISKDDIYAAVEKRVDLLVGYALERVLVSNRVEKMICNQIAEYLQKGFSNGYFSQTSFAELIKTQCQKAVREMLEREIEIKVTKK